MGAAAGIDNMFTALWLYWSALISEFTIKLFLEVKTDSERYRSNHGLVQIS